MVSLFLTQDQLRALLAKHANCGFEGTRVISYDSIMLHYCVRRAAPDSVLAGNGIELVERMSSAELGVLILKDLGSAVPSSINSVNLMREAAEAGWGIRVVLRYGGAVNASQWDDSNGQFGDH